MSAVEQWLTAVCLLLLCRQHHYQQDCFVAFITTCWTRESSFWHWSLYHWAVWRLHCSVQMCMWLPWHSVCWWTGMGKSAGSAEYLVLWSKQVKFCWTQHLCTLLWIFTIILLENACQYKTHDLVSEQIFLRCVCLWCCYVFGIQHLIKLLPSKCDIIWLLTNLVDSIVIILIDCF